jgi:Co/Zn/Cd efflux system component
MLNDVISLMVGLWAVKVANQKTNSKMYTYGVSASWLFSGRVTDKCSGNAPKPSAHS